MSLMRALFVLATLLSLALPPVAWGASGRLDPSNAATSSMSLAGPATAASQISRAITKSSNGFGLGCAIAPDVRAIALPDSPIALDACHASESPNVDPKDPPLAPRPPPLS
jgi:hypothetical protein